MSRARVVEASLVAVACLLAAAWAARRVAPALSADARPPRANVLEIAAVPAHGILAEAQRLRAHLASPPPFKAPSRNPFQFHAPLPPPASVARKKASPLTTASAPEHVERPEMKLVGIAEDRGPDGVVARTAIVNAMTQLFFVKEGERVLGRYEVVRITPDAAQLKDPDGQTFTIALR